MDMKTTRPESDAGFTLVEMLIAMVVVFTVLAVSMTVMVRGQAAVTTVGDAHNLNEEARQAINRMARDLRQASSIVTAVNPDGPAFNSSKIVAVRINADFDGDKCIGGLAMVGTTTPCLPYNSGNPEDITYCYDPALRQLYVIDNQSTPTPAPITSSSTNCDGGEPLLAGNVSAFSIEYRSNDYHFDLNPTDGITTWRELDSYGPPVGNQNGVLDAELPLIDSVVLNVTMNVNGHTQVYRTQVELRNHS